MARPKSRGTSKRDSKGQKSQQKLPQRLLRIYKDSAARRKAARNARRFEQSKQPIDRGPFVERMMMRAKDHWQRGNFAKAAENVLTISAGVSTGLAASPNNPLGMRAVAGGVAAATSPLALAANKMYGKQRYEYRRKPQNPENIRRVGRVKDADWLRSLEREFVKRYSVDPDGIERTLGVTPVGAAMHFGFSRGIRRSPVLERAKGETSPYVIKDHESKRFSSVVRPLLQYKVNQLPTSQSKKEVLDHHFPGENLKPIPREKLPSNLVGKTLRRLLDSEPQTPEDAVSMSLLAGAITRYNIQRAEGKANGKKTSYK